MTRLEAIEAELNEMTFVDGEHVLSNRIKNDVIAIITKHLTASSSEEEIGIALGAYEEEMGAQLPIVAAERGIKAALQSIFPEGDKQLEK